MVRATPLLVFIFGLFSAHAQIKLGGKTFEHENNELQSITVPSQTAEAIFVVHYTDALTKPQRQQAESNGILILDYVPDNNYLVSVANTADQNYLHSLPFDQWSPYTAQFKMSEALQNRQFPAHALENEESVWLTVSTHRHHKPGTLKEKLELNGHTLQQSNSATAIDVLVPIGEIKTFLNDPLIGFAGIQAPPSEPENLVGQTDHRSNYINSRLSGQLQYDGSGVNVALGDDGIIGPHIDYTGRINQSSVNSNTGDHGDHIAGTIAGAGNLDPTTEGMAPGAFLYVYRVWDAVNDADNDYSARNIRITSTSYSNGCNAGYTNFARRSDQDIRNYRALNHVFSAGNSNGNDCGYGAGTQWGNVTGGVKIGKNVICVANLNAQDQVANSSSRGPAHDGRIKPDISAVGSQVYSTTDPNDYTFKSGTSMSCPGVSGTLAQLFDAYTDIHGAEPDGGLLKAIMMNTADDIGNPGPDFIHGYGRINARRAYNIIKDSTFIIDSIGHNQQKTFTVSVPGSVQDLNVMLYWTDQEALSNTNVALVNNLDFELTDPNGNDTLPWVLDPTPNPANLNSPAIRGTDSLNNAEQVTLSQPASGTYTLTVNGPNVSFGPQKFYIVYEVRDESIQMTYPNGGEGFVPNETEMIRWDAPSTFTSFDLEYSIDSGSTWQTISTGIPASTKYYNWTVPQSVTGSALMRVKSGGAADASDGFFSISSLPNNPKVDWVCPDSLKISWGATAGVDRYEVSLLGNQYMDSVATVQQNFAVLHGIDISKEQWLSVRTVFSNGAKGRRVIAIHQQPGTFNCPIPEDIAVAEIEYPVRGQIPQCINDTASPVVVKVKNPGTNPVSNFDVGYQINANTPVVETVATTLNSGDSIIYSFTKKENFKLTGQFTIDSWVNLAQDANQYNDSIHSQFSVSSGQTVTVGITETFDTHGLCSDDADCGATTCDLINGWENWSNNGEDDIDWRVNSGDTPSNNTGPSSDHTTGSNGNYLYLEASNGCNFQEAVLQTPCIDLTNTPSAELSYWYHMRGSNIGELHVDIMVAGEIIKDVNAPVTGSQGNQWQQALVNLSPYSGKVITVLFRGITGDDYQSDISLDDIAVSAPSQPPVAQYSVSNSDVCPGEIVTLYDNSSNAPGQWTWKISPASYQFVNGTNRHSMNPQVNFNGNGYYNIELVVGNSAGSDSVLITNVLEVEAGTFGPYSMTFDNTFFAPSGWRVLNPGGIYTWQLAFNIIDKDSNTTISPYVNNHAYVNGGAEDVMETTAFDLTNSTEAYFTFDVAYVENTNGNKDKLRIDVSTDCGATFSPTGYLKEGQQLATAPAQSSLWEPTHPGHWRRDSIDLSPYLGKTCIFRFVNINGNGNGLYVDNVNLEDYSPPVASFKWENPQCIGDTILFTDRSFGYQKQYQWDFGPGAIPAQALTQGPHKVVFTGSGIQTVNLLVTNPKGVDSTVHQLTIDPIPTSNFTVNASQNGEDFTFYNTSLHTDSANWVVESNIVSNNTDSLTWTFDSSGTYSIRLVAFTSCGRDTFTRAVTADVDDISVAENRFNGHNIRLQPNPANDLVNISWTSIAPDKIEILDSRGRVMMHSTIKQDGSSQLNVDISGYATGTYFVKIKTKHRVLFQKLIKTP